MNYLRNTLPLIIIILFLAVITLPYFLNICIPDGCIFSPNICSDGVCLNETMGQHLNEKSQLFAAVVKQQIFFVIIVLLVLAFVIKKDIESNERFYVKFYASKSLLNPFANSNYLIEAISNGIVNPKIF